MAIFYDKIKGITSEGVLTHVQFTKSGTDNPLGSPILETTMVDSSTQQNNGYIIVSGGSNLTTNAKTTQTIQTNLKIAEKLEVTNDITTSGNITTTQNITTGGNITLSGQLQNQGSSLILNASEGSIKGSKITSTGEGNFNTLTVTGATGVGGKLSVTGLLGGSSATFSGSCQAKYFNATSDRNAKENIHSWDINALDTIKNINLYEFDYKDTKQPSVGVIAQEIESNQGFNGTKFNFVSTPEEGYKSVAESKFIYLALKGIQELQEENAFLREEIQKLQQGGVR